MPIFQPVGEKEVSKAIINEFLKQLYEYTESDVIIVGAGPSGLMAGKELAAAGTKVLIVERNNYPGGGFWMGGYFMNKVTVRGPANEIFDELGVPYKEFSPGLYIADAPSACSKLIAATCDTGVKFLSMTSFEDIILRENRRVAGIVINWASISNLPQGLSYADPIAIESKLVVDASGHGAEVVSKLEERGMIKKKGTGAMWIERSEDLLIKYTGEAHPGLIVTGMSVVTLYGLPRMGPTFGAMLISGKRAAKICLKKLKELQ